MTNTSIKLVAQTTKWIKLLAAIEGIGGILGIGRMLIIPNVGGHIGTASVFATVYVIGILAGWWLWRGEERGFCLSKIIWAIQIPLLIIYHVGWKVTVGLGLPIVLSFGGHGFSADVLIETSTCLLHHPPQVTLGINLVAAVALRYLFRVARSVPWRIVESGASSDNGGKIPHEDPSQSSPNQTEDSIKRDEDTKTEENSMQEKKG